MTGPSCDGRLVARRRRPWLGVAIVAATVGLAAGCGASSEDRRTDRRFRETWELRLEGHRAEWLLANAAVRRRSIAAMAALRSPEGQSWKTISHAALDLAASVRQAFGVAGRESTLARFLERTGSRPSAAGMRRWLEREAEDLAEESARVEAKIDRRIEDLSEDDVAVDNLLKEMEELAAEQGLILGRARELQAPYQSAIAYYSSLEEPNASALYADEDARRTAARGLASDVALRQSLVERRLAEAFARPRLCADDGRLRCRPASSPPSREVIDAHVPM